MRAVTNCICYDTPRGKEEVFHVSELYVVEMLLRRGVNVHATNKVTN